MGRALARLLAARGERLFWWNTGGRLEAGGPDLEIRGAAAPVKTAYCNLLEPETFAPGPRSGAAGTGQLDAVVVTAGLFGTRRNPWRAIPRWRPGC